MIRINFSAKARRAGGFTLVELLLAVSLVVMLMSALVFNFSNLMRGNQLEEGTVRLETLMRFARATAANSGRKVQLVFGSETTNAPATTNGELRATWEPDPLGQPGCFADLGDAQWHVQEVNDLVQVESVKVMDPSMTKAPASNGVDDDFEEEASSVGAVTPMAPITFYPDGSSDSAEIIVAAKTAEEEQRMSVRLVGLTGSISHQLLSSGSDETLDESDELNSIRAFRREGAMQNSSGRTDNGFQLLSARSAPTSSRMVPSSTQTPRTTVGDTNLLDLSE